MSQGHTPSRGSSGESLFLFFPVYPLLAALGESISFLSQLPLLAASIPWLVAVSLQSLTPSSHLLCVSVSSPLLSPVSCIPLIRIHVIVFMGPPG